MQGEGLVNLESHCKNSLQQGVNKGRPGAGRYRSRGKLYKEIQFFQGAKGGKLKGAKRSNVRRGGSEHYGETDGHGEPNKEVLGTEK